MSAKSDIRVRWAQPDICLDDWYSLRDSFEANWLSQGPKVAQFENFIASHSNRRHCVAVNSGTSALLAVLTALEVSDADEVILPAMSFIAVPFAVSMLGALPVLADVCENTGMISCETVIPCISDRTAVVIGIDYSGFANDWSNLSSLCKEREISLIVDSASSFLAKYRGTPAGSFGKAAIFSFHAAKPFTTGEGGAIVTDDEELAADLRRIRNHGEVVGEKYRYDLPGGNYRMTDVAASIGISSMTRAHTILERRRQVIHKYLQHKALNDLALDVYKNHDSDPNGFTFTILHRDRERLRHELTAWGVETRVMWPLCVHEQPAYSTLPVPLRGDIGGALRFSRRTLSLPVHSGIGEREMEYILHALDESLSLASG